MAATPTPTPDEHRTNDRIRAREVRLVDPEGKQLGIKPLPEALTIAREMDLDLVEVAPMANPPVCRIMDYNRFKYEEAQRAKESRRKSSTAQLKEMKYRLKIGPGDFETKTRKVASFLAEGHKVKITIMFRGREVDRPQFGKRILDNVAEQVTSVGKVEMAPRLDGRNMIMVLAPDKRAQAAAAKAASSPEGAEGAEGAEGVEGAEGSNALDHQTATPAAVTAAPTASDTTPPTTTDTSAAPAPETAASEATS